MFHQGVAAIGAIKNELRSWKSAAGVVLYQTALAWLISCLVFQVGRLFIR